MGQQVDPDEALHLLHHEFHYGGVSEVDFGRTTCAPTLADLTRLPMGILDPKEELLHGSHVAETADTLRDYAKRMISCSRNCDLIERVAERWPGQGSGMSRLEGHLANLWQIRSDHPPLYRALIIGRHRPVILALRDRRYAGMSATAARSMQEHDMRARIRRALECQTLLWCAHDVQMILARNAKAAAAPLGDLLSSDKTIVEPSTILPEARTMRATLMSVLDAYRAQWTAGMEDRADNTPLAEDYIACRLRLQVEREATHRGIEPERAAGRVAMLMDTIARRLQGANDAFLHAR